MLPYALFPQILPLRQQAEITNQWLQVRLRKILPKVMARENIDVWLVIAREYNEDPVFISLVPAPMLSARRRSILAFRRLDNGHVECWNFGRPEPSLNTLYSPLWEKAKEEQWECLARHLALWDPQKIGVNVSEATAFGDGLSKSLYDGLFTALPSSLQSRVCSAESVAVGWLEERLPEEIDAYGGINHIAHTIIDEAFSSKVVHPGVTTADDVAWWIRQRIQYLGLQAWFHPTVAIQRPTISAVRTDTPIRPGDLLHCDVGLHYLGLATDTQRMAYVLEHGETKLPQGIAEAFAQGNQLQDIFLEQFSAGKTGNDIFLASLENAKKSGLEAMIYTHPIGVHGHGAGPTMGLFDQQSFVPGTGEFLLHDNTCFAIELNVRVPIQGWEQNVMIALEQTATFHQGKVSYLNGRQTTPYLIG